MSREVATPKVVVAIPCFNEEAHIGRVIEQVDGLARAVIVIDDGSRDGTAEVASRAGARVVSHSTNRGYGGSIKSCFQTARDSGADILVILDGDGQHSPAELARVVAPILRGEAELVIGSRFLGGRDGMPGYREFGIRVITWLFNLGSRVKVSDAQSGYRAYHRRVLEALSPQESGMSVSTEILIRARRQGFRIAEVPITCSYHPGSSTLNPIRHGLGVALALVWLRLKLWWRGGRGQPERKVQVTRAR